MNAIFLVNLQLRMMRAEQQKEFASLAVTNSWQLMRLHIVIVVVRQLEH